MKDLTIARHCYHTAQGERPGTWGKVLQLTEQS